MSEAATYLAPSRFPDLVIIAWIAAELQHSCCTFLGHWSWSRRLVAPVKLNRFATGREIRLSRITTGFAATERARRAVVMRTVVENMSVVGALRDIKLPFDHL